MNVHGRTEVPEEWVGHETGAWWEGRARSRVVNPGHRAWWLGVGWMGACHWGRG